MQSNAEIIKLEKSKCTITIILLFVGCGICLFMAYSNFNYTLNGITTEATIIKVSEHFEKMKWRDGRRTSARPARHWLRIEYTFIDNNESGQNESSDFPYSGLTAEKRESLTAGKKFKIIYLPGVAGSSKPASSVSEIIGYIMVICAIIALTYAFINLREYLGFKKRRAIVDSKHKGKKGML